MNILRKRLKAKKQSGRQITTRKSLPVDRYYSPNRDSLQSSRRNSPDVRRSNATSERSERSAKERSKKLTHYIFQWSGMAVIAGVLFLNVGLFDTGVKLRQDVQSARFKTDAEYSQIVRSVFSSSLFNKSKLSFNSSSFEQELQERLPELSDAVAVMPLVGTKLQVGLVFTEPIIRVGLSGSDQGVIGSDGSLLFTDSSDNIATLYASLPFMSIEPRIAAAAGDQLLTSLETDLISLILREFDGSDSNRPSMQSIEYAIEKREFKLSFAQVGYYAKLTSERDVRTQVGALVASIDDLQQKGQEPTEYIDVRVDGRVFVK